MWRAEHSEHLDATPSDVWRLYSDPATWPAWGHSTAHASIDGPLEAGSVVTVEPTRGPRQHVRVVTFDPERRLETELKLPGARMRFSYAIEGEAQGCRVHHAVEMDGPTSGLFGLFMRRSNERKLVEETSRLARELGGAT